MSGRNMRKHGYPSAAVLGAAAALVFAQSPADAADTGVIAPGSGITYKIKAQADSSLCMNVANGSLGAGVHVEIFDYYCSNFDDNKAEKWTLAADGTLRVGGFCLQRHTTSLSWVTLENCTDNADQQWRRGLGGTLYSANTNLCLTAFQVRKSQDLQTQDCDDENSGQKWMFSAYRGDDVNPSTGNVYGMGNQCVVWFYHANKPPANGSSVKVNPCDDSRVVAPQWTLGADGTLRAWYINGQGGAATKSNSCLGISDDSGTSGTNVTVWQCSGAPSQEWWSTSDGALFNPSSGLCLTVDQDAVSPTGEKNLLKAKDCDQNPSQVWSLPGEVEA